MPLPRPSSVPLRSCCVCDARDARALVDVVLDGGARATLCGSHALMHGQSLPQATSIDELRRTLRDRRGRRDRREEGDELGEALTAAFRADLRTSDRRA
jgi:hypothetical protein